MATLTGEVDLSNATQICDAIGEATPNTALGVVLDLAPSITSTAPGST